MTYWTIEELAWDILLVGAGKEDLEKTLNMSLLTPDSYSVTLEQVIAVVQASSSDVSLDDLDLDAARFSFFLSAVQGD
ncbi:hypothetical protein [Actinophytocola algeriensis]|uniref:Uncharacterized protein n=1 Tax=Actinophytocola algeriensis TaxID=1768010 RepID=A0A7W7QAN4_9PSEU|nr:hypothetical protein [Actinophytocola algeriensis]MBB4910089.1 hypothetical protein [Actinophytocola algeriensis]MBE1476079.1 hypothetical protein [Actinophytocola algeriensis]